MSGVNRHAGLDTLLERPYEYKDTAALLSDFWAEVDAVLKERGVIQ